MSFFFEAERKTNMETKGTPSPFDYTPKEPNYTTFAQVPFGSKVELHRFEKKSEKEITKTQKVVNDDVFMVNDLNIKIKAQQNMSSMFKSSSHRFINKNTNVDGPGPGQYEATSKLNHNKPSHKSNANINKHFIIDKVNKQAIPSIPTDHLGYKEGENKMMKKVNLPTPQHPHPGSYDIATKLEAKSVLVWKVENQIFKETQPHPGPAYYVQTQNNKAKSFSSCFSSAVNRFDRFQIRSTPIPGPGQYNPLEPKKISHNIATQGYFNSKTSRFSHLKQQDSLGPGTYFNKNKKKSQSVITFKKFRVDEDEENKILMKKSIFDINNVNPGPGEYKTNYGMTYQMQKQLLRKHSNSLFPTQKRKIFEGKEQQPGPGAYEPVEKKKLLKGKIHKRTEIINLKQEELPTPSPADYANYSHTISAKVKQINSKVTLTEEKPFNSATQRFKHYSHQPTHHPNINHQTNNQEDTQEHLLEASQKKVKRLVMTTIKVRVPFGLSSTKYQEKGLHSQQYQGPDFYQKPSSWIKSTFNLKGQLQMK